MFIRREEEFIMVRFMSPLMYKDSFLLTVLILNTSLLSFLSKIFTKLTLLKFSYDAFQQLSLVSNLQVLKRNENESSFHNLVAETEEWQIPATTTYTEAPERSPMDGAEYRARHFLSFVLYSSAASPGLCLSHKY
jgi:hypothetical protein